jgi:8-oxo-dGTP pyrophosphatase MutT (NUDIX family)
MVDLRQFQPANDKERRDLERIQAFVKSHERPFDRGITEGHLTGSAIVVSHDGSRVMLIHHAKFGRWMQPGGHGEPGDSSGEAVALREAREETGVEEIALHPSAPRPFDVDIHAIPARGSEPAHDHLDIRYLLVAADEVALNRALDETNDARWFSWDEAEALDLDESLRRALRKARALAGEPEARISPRGFGPVLSSGLERSGIDPSRSS